MYEVEVVRVSVRLSRSRSDLEIDSAAWQRWRGVVCTVVSVVYAVSDLVQ